MIAAVVGAADALVQPLVPQEPLAFGVDHPARCCSSPGRRQRPVGAVGGEEHIVLGDGRAQQRGRVSADQQPIMREQAGVVAEQAVRDSQDVAIGVGHKEGIAILQREETVGNPRFGDLAAVA